MQSTMPKSIHTISTLACLALAGTLAACGNNSSNNNGGSDNKPAITFDKTSDGDRTQIYAGVSPGGKFTNVADVAAKGKCTVLPTPTYSSPDYTSDTSKILVDVTSGEVTYKAAGDYTITASTAATTGNSKCDTASAQYTLIVNKAIADLTFDSATDSVTKGESKTIPATPRGVGGDSSTDMGGTISYYSDNTSIASVDASSGEVTGKRLSSTGAVTITATYAGSDNYKDVTGKYQLTVTLKAAELDVSSSPIKKLIFSWQDVSDAAYYKLWEIRSGGMNTQVGQDVTAGNTGSVQSFTRIVPLFASAGTQYMLESCDSARACIPSTNQPITQAQLNRAIGYIKASNTGYGDFFGHSFSLSLSADGTTLAVGANAEQSDATGVYNSQSEWGTAEVGGNDNTSNAGAVYVFSRDTTTDNWSQQAYIKASNTGGDDRFGISLSLNADGTILAVGALFEKSDATGVGGNQSDDSVDKAGAVYVFSRTNSTSRDWTQDAYIKASNTGGDDRFGISLSLNADGTILAVGASQEDSSADRVGNDQDEWDAMNNNNLGLGGNAGAVYVFSRDVSGDWSQDAYIKASNTGGKDYFGTRLSLSPDGTTLAVGAPYEGSGAGYSGAVYVFSRAGDDWTEDAYIKASNIGGVDYFGWSVSLDASGNTLAVGAYGEDSRATGVYNNQTQWSTAGVDDNNVALRAGAVYMFTRTSRDWTQDAYIKASNTGAGDQFGWSVSLDASGDTLAVGADLEDSKTTGIGGDQSDNSADKAGAVYVFTRTSSTSRDWSQRAYIKASNTGFEDYFGSSVSLDASGNTLAVGAYREKSNATGIGGDQSNDSERNSGAVYLY